MGKSKSRILRKGIYDQVAKISRAEAVENAAKYLNENNIQNASDLITMFGLNAEEVLEAGASYEAVISIKNIFKTL